MRIFRPVIVWVKAHPIISLVIALIIAAVLYRVLVPTAPTYEYIGETVSEGEVDRIVSASGKLRALNTIKVGSEISGQVVAVYVDFNSPVVAGQVLARIDPTRPQARVAQARAQVDLAKASLMQAEAAINRAQTDYEVQSREFSRRRELAEKGFVSKAGLDQAENILANARASRITAQAQAASSRAQIAQSSAELSSAMLDLNRTNITAPTSGVVINKLVEPGTTVAASFQTPNLFEIAADTSRMQVEASVDEADIGQVRVGQSVRFTVDSYPDETFVATVQQIRKSATEGQTAVSYLVILDVDNQQGKLLTGMTANVEIITGRQLKALRVPSAAIRFRPRKDDRPDDQAQDKPDAKPEGGETGAATNRKPAKSKNTAIIWLMGRDPLKPVRRKVIIGLEGEDYVEIIQGLKAGDKVLVRSRNLDNGDDDEDDFADEGA